MRSLMILALFFVGIQSTVNANPNQDRVGKDKNIPCNFELKSGSPVVYVEQGSSKYACGRTEEDKALVNYGTDSEGFWKVPCVELTSQSNEKSKNKSGNADPTTHGANVKGFFIYRKGSQVRFNVDLKSDNTAVANGQTARGTKCKLSNGGRVANQNIR